MSNIKKLVSHIAEIVPSGSKENQVKPNQEAQAFKRYLLLKSLYPHACYMATTKTNIPYNRPFETC